MRVGSAIGNLATAFVLLCAAASVTLLVSVHYSGFVAESDAGLFVYVIPSYAFLALPLVFLARDHLLRRAGLTLGGWLVTMICLLAAVNMDQGASFPGISVPKLPSVRIGALSTPRMTRVQVLGRAQDAGLRIEVHANRWPSPSLRAWARGTHVGWAPPWGTAGAPFVALVNGSAEAPQVLRGLLVKDRFTIRDVGFSDGLTFVIADAPGATPANPVRVRAIDRALHGTA